MLASVPNPREVFQSDEFLVQLAQQSNVRFSQSEHAPVEERREKFREAIAQRKLPLTFTDAGVNLSLDISTSNTSGNKRPTPYGMEPSHGHLIKWKLFAQWDFRSEAG
ncbi:hypothetical protein TELCIR_02876 [Teladorsagia circumcincta]|uniref:Uncharacterized protein n=1 Tax=Teladorsagia circumcincta TaxID=45464 RepID=A0A2G9UXZ1_TELCI|nr:hypothetical protein TELCIR_02876 [Teladorsagia circumcincta]